MLSMKSIGLFMPTLYNCGFNSNCIKHRPEKEMLKKKKKKPVMNILINIKSTILIWKVTRKREISELLLVSKPSDIFIFNLIM